jgi:hypothetical protein
MPIALNTTVHREVGKLCQRSSVFTVYTVVANTREAMGPAYEVPFSAVSNLLVRALTVGKHGLQEYLVTSLTPPAEIAKAVAVGRGASPTKDAGRVMVFFPRRGILGPARVKQLTTDLWADISG